MWLPVMVPKPQHKPEDWGGGGVGLERIPFLMISASSILYPWFIEDFSFTNMFKTPEKAKRKARIRLDRQDHCQEGYWDSLKRMLFFKKLIQLSL
jgi:hypothetical protein